MSNTPNIPETLAKIDAYGILDESADEIQQRLKLSLQGVAAIEGGHTIQLGVGDWTNGIINKFQAALRLELCDPEKKLLKDEYQKMFQKSLSPQGIAIVTGVVIKVIASVNPAFAVPTVAIYMSIWLMKVGLNYWCSIDQKAEA